MLFLEIINFFLTGLKYYRLFSILYKNFSLVQLFSLPLVLLLSQKLYLYKCLHSITNFLYSTNKIIIYNVKFTDICTYVYLDDYIVTLYFSLKDFLVLVYFVSQIC